MSDLPDSRQTPSNNPPRNLGVPIAPAARTSDADHQRPSVTSTQSELPTARSVALPSVASLTEAGRPRSDHPSGASHTAWRSIGVHNILNPSSETHEHGRTSSPAAEPRALAPTAASPVIRKRGVSVSPTREQESQQVHHARRILTAKSPSLRAASLGAHRSPSLGPGPVTRGPVRANESPLQSLRQAETAIPPVPPLPPAMIGKQTNDLGQGSVGFPPAGPNAFHSMQILPSVSPSAHGSSAPAPGMYQTSPVRAAPTPPPNVKHEPQVGLPPLSQAVSRSSGPYGQGGWKMTLDTQQGPVTLDVGVDYQQASKMADEKRRRNAGASARFRARRKEKEKEASQTISSLQQDLRAMQDERDFYIGERNFFRDLFLSRNPPGAVPPRPASPRTRQGPSGPPSTTDRSQDGAYSRHDDDDLPPAGQRRTSEFQGSYLAPTASNPPYPPPYSFPPQAPPAAATPAYAHSAPPHPAGTGTTSGPVAGAAFPDTRPVGPPHPTQSSFPQPLDPFRRDVLNRNWTQAP